VTTDLQKAKWWEAGWRRALTAYTRKGNNKQFNKAINQRVKSAVRLRRMKAIQMCKWVFLCLPITTKKGRGDKNG